MKKFIYIIAPVIICCLGTYAQSIPVKKEEAKDMILDMHRKKIDSLDQSLIKILGERERIVKEIGVYKASKNIPALQASRFQQVLDRAIAAGRKEGLSEEFITTFLNALHKESLRIEEELITKK